MHRSPDLDHAAADAALLAREDVRRLLASRLHDPFALLGRHGEEIRLWRPWAVAAWVGAERVPARRVGTSGLFVLRHDGAPGPHPEVHWRDVAGAFHSYYAHERFLVDDAELARARMALLSATRQVLRNALAVLGVSAPQRMDREQPALETA